MVRCISTVVVAVVLGIHPAPAGFAQDALLVPPAPEPMVLAPPVPVGPYYAYNEPVYVSPAYVTPVYVSPAWVQPVVPAPVIVAADWYAPTYVEVHSSPWSYRAEYEYATPYGARDIEYRVDRDGGFRIEYDD